jgi:hypothetical protein
MLHNQNLLSTFAGMREIIDKWKINKSVLATKMSMTNTTFNKKLKNDSFADEELIQLKRILTEMSSDIDSVAGIDFNDALKLITK